MRKIASFIVGFVMVGLVNAQVQFLPIDEKTGKATYMEVVESKGMTATEIFKVMKDWTTKKGFEMVSSEGQIADFKCKMKVSYANPKKTGSDEGAISFTANLMAKDGRYRYIFTDFSHSSKLCQGGDLVLNKLPCSPSRISIAGWAKAKKETNRKMRILIEDLKRVIKEATNDPSKNDDW